MKLRELQALAVNYVEDMKLPGTQQFSKQDFPVILELKAGNEELLVKDNGFAKYSNIIGSKIRSTVFCIFELKLFYEYTGCGCEIVKLSDFPEFLEHDAVEVLRMCGQDRLDHNTYSRDKYWEEGVLDGNGDYYERQENTRHKAITNCQNDFVDALIESMDMEQELDKYKKLHDAESLLTEAQAEVVQLHFYQNMTQKAVASKLGISRSSVQSRLNTAIKKLRKHIK